jgi:hypothetical protein
LVARLSYTGLTGDAVGPERRLRAWLGVLGLAVSLFVLVGVALWAQLTIGWQWSQPAARPTRVAMELMSISGFAFAVLGLLAALPLAWSALFTLRHRRSPVLLAGGVAVAIGGVVLVVGSIHFGHGWPGTGGHPWAGRGLVPDPVARFAWAGTVWITSYWAHPAALASFPTRELAWMAVSPLAVLSIVAGATVVLPRIQLSARVLRYECRLGVAACAVLAVFLAGAASWVLSGGPGPRELFRVGAIDMAGVAVMASALLVAFRATQRALAT